MCEDKIARLNLNITSKQAICINAETTLNTLSDPSEFKYVFALNAHDLNLSSTEIMDVFGDVKFTLVVAGICAGKCSRLLMPIAGKTVFTKNSFAALTDNSIPSKAYHNREHLSVKMKNNTLNMQDIHDAEDKYQTRISEEYLPDIKIIKLSKKSVTHLTWNSFVRQSLVTQLDRKCLPINSVVVILNRNYLKMNLFTLKGNYSPPSDETIINEIGKAFPEKSILIHSYDHQPFYGADNCRVSTPEFTQAAKK